MTAARRAANHRNALKSTGPRTACGTGIARPSTASSWLGLLDAPPGTPVATTVRALLTGEETGHPVFAELIDVHYEMELEDQAYEKRLRRRARRAHRDPERSLEAAENNGSGQNQTIVKLTTY